MNKQIKMEFSKKHLQQTIKESSREEFDEMAYQRGKTEPWNPDYPKDPEGNPDFMGTEPKKDVKNYSFNPYKGDNPEDAGIKFDVWVYMGHKKIAAEFETKEQVESQAPGFFNWVDSMCKKHGFEFVENPKYIDKKGKEYGIKVGYDPLELSRAKYSPKAASLRNTMGIEIPDKDAEDLSVVTKIKRSLIGATRNWLGRKSETQSHADAVGLPIINLPRQMPGHLKQGTNTYGTVNNGTIVWGSKNYDKYENFETLAKLFDHLVEDKDNIINPEELPFKKTSFLDRLYNMTSKRNDEQPEEIKPNEIRIWSEIEINGTAKSSFATFEWEIEVSYTLVTSGKNVKLFKPFVSTQMGQVPNWLRKEIMEYKGQEGYGPHILKEGSGDDMGNPVRGALSKALEEIAKQINNVKITNMIDALSNPKAFGQQFDDYITGGDYENPAVGGKETPKAKKATKKVGEPTITTKKVGKKQVAKESKTDLSMKVIEEIKMRAKKKIK